MGERLQEGVGENPCIAEQWRAAIEIQLAASRAPETRSPTYVQLDARIADSKLN